MPNADLPQDMYMPISQNISDSDSEEEIHLRSNIRNHTQTTANMNRYMDDCDLVSGRNNDIISDVNYGNVQFSHYYTSDGEGKPYADANNGCYILNSNVKSHLAMSPLRKFCFIVSIFVCVLTIVLFMWVIPCSDSQTCPAKTDRIQTHNWMRNYERVEIKGTINIVPGLRGRSKNLIFMYRGDVIFPDEKQRTANRSGIISLMGSSGQVGWYDPMKNEPSVIDCSLIDADQNGVPDCLVLDEVGEIRCINPISGQWLWHISDKTANNPEQLGFPLILPDIDWDGVKDLLIACVTGTNGTYNMLKFISGATGRIIGKSYIIDKCSYIHKFQLEQSKVSFNCINNETELRMTRDLQELCKEAHIHHDKTLLTKNAPTINQHKFYGQRKDTVSQRNIYSLRGKQLIVENNGVCPDSCNVTVTLLEEKTGKIIRNFNGSRMYGMVPARLSFNNFDNNTKSPIYGFVIKFWEWGANETIITNIHKINKRKTTTVDLKEFNKFTNILRKKRSWNPPSPDSKHNQIGIDQEKKVNTQQAATNKSGAVGTITSRMRLIKETVVLIIFNSTDTRIENTSQSNIIQFCNNSTRKELVCQPDLNYQENSLLIADLDQDGSQELVSYYSTFVETEAEQNKWKLITYVQLLRLESELPKLYAAADDKN